MLVACSALHPIGFNPLLAPSSELEPVSRSTLLGLAPSSGDEEGSNAFERDVEGEQALLRLLGGSFDVRESAEREGREEEESSTVLEPEVLGPFTSLSLTFSLACSFPASDHVICPP